MTGFDGVHIGRHLHPGLTTVAQPMRELGETAVRLLQRRVGHPPGASIQTGPAEDVELPVRLEVRESCGCAVTDGSGQDGETA